MELYEIAKVNKNICGIQTEYTLFKANSNIYSIEIKRGEDTVKEVFNGDFFSIVKLFETIFNTDTLPENLPEIACDAKNTFYV